MLQILLNSSRHCHYFAFDLGKTYRMDVRRNQDDSIDNAATLARYNNGKNASIL